ncbi:MAG: SpoVA/SpoVAEb family sporulation membrane protein [Acetatifactor sp.]|nr:SpoVA/SpoVAEb family sporulation membrane protein [Acetatifactor sp.]
MEETKRQQTVQGQQESQQQKAQQQKEYEKYVKEVTPTHNLWLQMLKAFITGGIICCIGQFILNYAGGQGLDKQTAGSWCSLILVLLSVILTGFGIYPKIVKWGGAGALVPITGFANSVAAPAIEYKAEGQVFGIGSKIFTIAGPVILYGIFASWLLGLGYWIGKCFGVW